MSQAQASLASSQIPYKSLEEPHTDVPTAKPAVVSKETPAIPNIWPFKFAFGKRSYSANFADDRLQLAEYRPSGQGNYGTLVAYVESKNAVVSAEDSSAQANSPAGFPSAKERKLARLLHKKHPPYVRFG
ncbi:hypothetical protein AAVH_14745 [Aphelenchoides avenae]|nr:hypothetical protein AAVH_14745 [Aphelenchus avenae]